MLLLDPFEPSIAAMDFFFFFPRFSAYSFFFGSLFDIGFIGRACAARGRDFGCGSRDEWRSRPRGERETG